KNPGVSLPHTRSRELCWIFFLLALEARNKELVARITQAAAIFHPRLAVTLLQEMEKNEIELSALAILCCLRAKDLEDNDVTYLVKKIPAVILKALPSTAEHESNLIALCMSSDDRSYIPALIDLLMNSAQGQEPTLGSFEKIFFQFL